MTGLYTRFHRWKRPSRTNAEPDLFHWVCGCGFVTIYIEKRSLLEAYRKLRRTIAEAVERQRREDEEGR